jgi:hypothetical protein
MIAGFVDAYGIVTYGTYLSFMSGNTTRQRSSYDMSIKTNNVCAEDRSSLPESILENIADAVIYADRGSSDGGTKPLPPCSATAPARRSGRVST